MKTQSFICPHCGMDFNQPSASQIIDLLRQDSRRDIYETASDYNGKRGSGFYTISYANGQRMPHFSREVALAVAATGIIREYDCKGWFRREQEA